MKGRNTIIKLEVLFRYKGIGPPYNHFPDQVGILRCRNQSCDSPITPPQQRELSKPQSLPVKCKTAYNVEQIVRLLIELRLADLD